MKNFLLLIFTLVASANAFLQDYPNKNGVVMLNRARHKEILDRFDYTLVEFSSKTCRACNIMFDVLAELNKIFHEQLDFALPVSKFNCQDDPIYCQNIEDIKGYPSLRLYMNDRKVFSSYTGKVKLHRIASWINDRVFNSYIEITKPRHHEQIREYVDNDGVLIFVYFGNPNTTSWNIVKNFAFTQTHAAFYWTNNIRELEKFPHMEITDLADAYEKGLFFVMKPHDEPIIMQKHKITMDNLEDFYTQNKEPMMHKFDLKYVKKISKRDTPTLILISSNWDEQTLEEYMHVAHQYKGKEEVHFTHIDLSAKNNNFKTLEVVEKILGVHVSDMPTLRVVQPDKKLITWNQKAFEGRILNRTTIKAFVRSQIRDKIKPHSKSQKLTPGTEKTADTLNIVVRDNFKELVTNYPQDVVLFAMGEEAYCGECREIEKMITGIEKEYLEQGKKQKFYKLDVHRNDLEDWMFTMTPEIVYFRRDSDVSTDLASMDSDFTITRIKDFQDMNYNDKLDNKTDL